MSPRRNYGFDRRQREALRKTRQEAKQARKAERATDGSTGPEMCDAPETSAPAGQWEWFSASGDRAQAATGGRGPRRLGAPDGSRRRRVAGVGRLRQRDRPRGDDLEGAQRHEEQHHHEEQKHSHRAIPSFLLRVHTQRSMQAAARTISPGRFFPVESRPVISSSQSAEESDMPVTRAIAFDAFTTFDPGSVATRAEEVFPGRGAELAGAWRTRQFEYAWLRTLMGRYADFWQVTDEA